jgi:muramoyltetrapeptide carboxypeptidase
LGPGSIVRVVAPASPFETPLVWRALGWLSERYRVRFDRGIFTRSGYLCGDDARRARELGAALAEPDVAAIFCTRGGYGISRFAHELDWSLLRSAPRWIVGFSDVTALHVEAARQGVASLHASNLSGLGRGDAALRNALVETLEHPHETRSFEGLTTLVAGEASGTLFGGNLTLLHACAAAGRLALPERCILLLEDVSERPYRIDRMLTTLIVGKHLDAVSGVVLGEFDRCTAGPDGVTTDDVLAERLALLRVPIAAGLPVGHGRHNHPLVLGTPASLVAEPSGAQLITRREITRR